MIGDSGGWCLLAFTVGLAKRLHECSSAGVVTPGLHTPRRGVGTPPPIMIAVSDLDVGFCPTITAAGVLHRTLEGLDELFLLELLVVGDVLA